MPLKNPDFAPFLQQIKDAKPEAVFVFLPPGAETIAFMKGFNERGLAQAGIRLIATGDMHRRGRPRRDGRSGARRRSRRSTIRAAHKSPENAAFTEAYAKAYPKDRPNFMAVGGYDGMQLIAEVLKKTGGNTDADKSMAAAKGMKLDQPARARSRSIPRRATSCRPSTSARSRRSAASCRTSSSTRSPTSRIPGKQ